MIIVAGAVGLLIGLILLLVFLTRRILFAAKRLAKKPSPAPAKPLASLRNLLLILLWTAVFGMALFAGFFFRAYHAFTLEEPVAEIVVERQAPDLPASITLVQEGPGKEPRVSRFDLLGDQWVLEGDILKWGDWLNFLGLRTRYRLTRLRSRYIQSSDERAKPSSIHSLVENEDDPLWRYLYRYGPRLPLVSTAYGSAVFQMSDESGAFRVFVGTSGLIVRRVGSPRPSSDDAGAALAGSRVSSPGECSARNGDPGGELRDLLPPALLERPFHAGHQHLALGDLD
ncbi:MAG: hypothetical protein JW775_12485 [Candidatus Aminicenantes bacterium]|nr:hypothetical protein [Candidatus Aminicenantes bacterium]